MQASILWSFTTGERRDARESVQIRKGRLLGLVLGQPLLAPALGFTLLVLSLQAGLLVKPATLELPEQPFASQLFLGDLQRFFDVVVKNLNFHPANRRPPDGGCRQGYDRPGRHDQPSARSVTGYTHPANSPSRRGGCTSGYRVLTCHPPFT